VRKTANKNIAQVALFDPIRQNLRSTRYTLSELSFREVDGYSDLKEFRQRLNDKPADLVMVEADDDGEIYDLVKALRNGDLGDNPFAVVFVTCWKRDPDNIHAAIQSGADDLIARPFSTNFLESRVISAVQKRKRFVVTSDYVGPDRRSSERSGAMQPRFIDPPNTLKAATKGDEAALERMQNEIESARGDMVNEKARRLAIRIAADFDLTDPSQAESELTILRQARELSRVTENVGEQASAMARALVRAMTDNAHSTPEKRWRIGKELAQGVSVACSIDGDEAGAAAEIDQLVSSMREKQQETEVDAGLEALKRLNSAA